MSVKMFVSIESKSGPDNTWYTAFLSNLFGEVSVYFKVNDENIEQCVLSMDRTWLHYWEGFKCEHIDDDETSSNKQEQYWY